MQELEYSVNLMNGRSGFGKYNVCSEHERIYLTEIGCPSCLIDAFQASKIAPMDESASARQVGGDHYKDMAIQPTEFAHKNKLGACETLCLRYICRHGKKNGRQDIEKAIHVLELLLELEYPE